MLNRTFDFGFINKEEEIPQVNYNYQTLQLCQVNLLYDDMEKAFLNNRKKRNQKLFKQRFNNQQIGEQTNGQLIENNRNSSSSNQTSLKRKQQENNDDDDTQVIKDEKVLASSALKYIVVQKQLKQRIQQKRNTILNPQIHSEQKRFKTVAEQVLAKVQKQRRSILKTNDKDLNNSLLSNILQNSIVNKPNTDNVSVTFEMQSAISQEEQLYDTNFDVNTVILYPNYSQQSDIILQFILKGQAPFYKDSQYILKKWVRCLPREDRMDVERDKTYFPVPRHIHLYSIDKGLNMLYGVGKKRILRPGEEASIISAIEKFLQECQKDIQILAVNGVITIQKKILKNTDLEELLDHPICLKQIELHWKIMATRFRYSGNLPMKNKNFDKLLQMAQSRGHFLNLLKIDNPLVLYLLRHSSLNKMQNSSSRRDYQ